MKLAHQLASLAVMATVASCGAEPSQDRQSGVIASASAQQAQQSPARRLWVLGPSDDVYDVSADGRFAGYIDWNTGNLMVRDLRSGEVRNLTNKGTYEQTRDEAESALFSPDGQWVAYEWWNAQARQDELRIASIDGKTVRTLLIPKGYSVWPEEWTKDGKFILTYLQACTSCAERSDEEMTRAVLVPLAGDSVRTLKRFPGGSAGWWEASPDGRYFAFSARPNPTRDRRDIHILEVSTLKETKVLEDTTGAFTVGWNNAGHLVFLSGRNGAPALWSIEIANGRGRGEPRLLRADLWNTSPLRLLNDNRVAYTLRAGNRDILTAAFDPTSGKLLSQPASLTQRPGEAYHTPVWSPDGRHVAFVTRRPNSGTTFTIRSVDGGEAREIRDTRGPGQLNWLANGQAMLLTATDERGQTAIYRYDLASGETRVVVRDVYPVVSSSKDSRLMYFIPRTAQGGRELKSIDLATGMQRVLFTGPEGVDLRHHFVTDDGKTALLVVVRSGRPRGFWAISLESGTVTNLGASIPIGPREWMRPVGRTADGLQQLMATAALDASVFETLWRVPIAGGPAVRLAPAPNAVSDVQSAHSWVSPDGRRIMYVSGDLSTELWTIGPLAVGR